MIESTPMYQMLVASRRKPQFDLWGSSTKNKLLALLCLIGFGSRLSEWKDMLSVLDEHELVLLEALHIDEKHFQEWNNCSFNWKSKYRSYDVDPKISVNTITKGSKGTNIMFANLLNNILEKWRINGFDINHIMLKILELPEISQIFALPKDLQNVKRPKSQYEIFQKFVDADMVLSIFLDMHKDMIVDLSDKLELKEKPIIFFDEDNTSTYDYLFDLNGILKATSIKSIYESQQNPSMLASQLFDDLYQEKLVHIISSPTFLEKYTRNPYTNLFHKPFYQEHVLFDLLKNYIDIPKVWQIMQSSNLFNRFDLVQSGLIMAHAVINTPTEIFKNDKYLIGDNLYKKVEQVLNENTIAYWDKEQQNHFVPMPTSSIKHNEHIKIGLPPNENIKCNPLYRDWFKRLRSLSYRSSIHHHFDLIGVRDGITFVTKRPTLGLPFHCLKSGDSQTKTLSVCNLNMKQRSSLSEQSSEKRVINNENQVETGIANIEKLYVDSVFSLGEYTFYDAFPNDDVQPRLKSHLTDIHADWEPLTLNAEAIELRQTYWGKFHIWFNGKKIATPMVPKETNMAVQSFIDNYFKRNTTVFNYDRLLSIVAIMNWYLPNVLPNLHNFKLINDVVEQMPEIEQIKLTATILKILREPIHSSVEIEFDQKHNIENLPFLNDFQQLIKKEAKWQDLPFDMQPKPMFIKTVQKSEVEPFVVVHDSLNQENIDKILMGNLYCKTNEKKATYWKDLLKLLTNNNSLKNNIDYQYAISEYLEIKNEMRFVVYNGKVVSAYPCQRQASYPQTYLFGRIAPFFTRNHNSVSNFTNRKLAAKMTRFARIVAKEHYHLYKSLGYLYEGDVGVAPQSFLFLDIGTVWNEVTQENEFILIEAHNHQETLVNRGSWYANNQARLYKQVYNEVFSMNEHWNYLFGEHIEGKELSDLKEQPQSYISKYIKHLKTQGVPIKPFITFEKAQQLRKQGVDLNNIEDVIAYHIQWDKMENQFKTDLVDIPALLAKNEVPNLATIKQKQPFFDNADNNNLFNKPLLLEMFLSRHHHLCHLQCCNENDRRVLQKILELECARLFQVKWCYIKPNRVYQSKYTKMGGNIKYLNHSMGEGMKITNTYCYFEPVVYLLKMNRLKKQLSPELKQYIDLKYGMNAI